MVLYVLEKLVIFAKRKSMMIILQT